MKDEYSYIGNVFGIVFSAIQQNEVLSIISWIITLVATLLSISYTIYRWVKKAKQDGKIDEREIEELGEIVDDAKDKLEEVTKDGKDK